jgi:integrase
VSPARRRQGEGSLSFNERTQRWRGSLELPPDPDGKRRRWETTSKTKSVVIKKLNAERARLDRGEVVLSSTSTLDAWLDYWMANVVRVKPKTRESYRSSLRYARAGLGQKKLGSITIDDVRTWHRRMLAGDFSEGPLSSTTAHTAHGVLSKAMKDAVREGRAVKNVVELVPPPPRAVAPVNVLSRDEVARVITTVADDRLGSRWAAALLTGARQGELLGLEWDRVDFNRNRIDLGWQLQRLTFAHGCGKLDDGRWSCLRARGHSCPQAHVDVPADFEHRVLDGGLMLTRPKSKAGWRVIPMGPRLRAILLHRHAASVREPNPHGLVWTSDWKRSPLTGLRQPLDGSPIDMTTDSRAWHGVLDRAGVKQVRLHDARHTAVTLLYDAEIPEAVIQQIVGQSTIATTRGYRATFDYQMEAGMLVLEGALDGELVEPDTPELIVEPEDDTQQITQ